MTSQALTGVVGRESVCTCLDRQESNSQAHSTMSPLGGTVGEAIFLDDADRKRFLSQLRDCLKNYRVVLYAYVLMPNHYHLLVRTAHPNLARFMQRLNTSYAP
jgi:hypothetical protein